MPTKTKSITPTKSSKKKKAPKPDLSGNYIIFGLDSSLNRPGVCIYKKTSNDVEVSTFNLQSDKTRSHGYRLRAIYDWLTSLFLLNCKDNVKTIFVREHAFNSRASQYEIGIFEAVGISDLFLYDYSKQEDWFEIYPVSIKKWMTGEGKADKKKVEAALEPYLGKRVYACDDESDAAAVVITFLIMNGELESFVKSE